MAPPLSLATLPRAAPSVRWPAYDPASLGIGIVHLGMGAFFRAHQAVYTDDALAAAGGGWGCCGVSLRSAATRDRLRAQDGLYSVVERTAATETARIVGCLRERLALPDDRERILARLADPRVSIVTLTVTEKGYCRDPSTGGLDEGHADIRHDRARPGAEASVPGLLAAALRRRRDGGAGALTLISCDNLPGNGRVLEAVVRGFAGPGLDAWIDRHARFPSTMVDGIVPAARPEDGAAASALLGLEDAAPVVTEPFRRWVVEDDFAGPRPAWEAAGVDLVADAAPFEAMKLRLLNAVHSALAYLGCLSGHEFIFQALADPALARYAARLQAEELMPTVPGHGTEAVQAYARAVLPRFANPALGHRTRQVATDGSQKLPPRLLAPLRERLAAGAPVDGIALAVAAWMAFVAESGPALADPLAGPLAAALQGAQRRADGIAPRLLGLEAVFGRDLAADDRFTAPLAEALDDILAHGAAAAVRRRYG